MDDLWIYLAAAAAGVGVIILLIMLRVRKKRRQGVQPKNNITVKNGVDVYHQVVGSTKGEHFLEGAVGNGTLMVNREKRQQREQSICLQNINTGAQYRQNVREYLYIGRMADNGQYDKLVIPNDSRISGTHCVIYESGGALYLSDMQSRNHTYLNGVMVTEPVGLASGDCIRIGNTSLMVYF